MVHRLQIVNNMKLTPWSQKQTWTDHQYATCCILSTNHFQHDCPSQLAHAAPRYVSSTEHRNKELLIFGILDLGLYWPGADQ